MKELGNTLAPPTSWPGPPCSNNPRVGEDDKAMLLAEACVARMNSLYI